MLNTKFISKYLKIIIFVILVVIVASYLFWKNKNNDQPVVALLINNTNEEAKTVDKTNDITTIVLVSEPISNALGRVTKKPFGIKISPEDSPVRPERFSGYHTGVDFETTADEQKIDIDVMAICDGKIIYKDWVNGYGGVVIESCVIDKQTVTVIYGHLKLASVLLKTGSTIKAGEKLAVLGQAYSSETNGERKHLHLAIHQGDKINLLGYAKNKADLVNWVDITKYLVK